MSRLDEDTVLQKLMNTILFVAMEDGVVSEDELAILKQVKLDINTLRDTIKEIEQSEISDKEVEMMRNFRKDLLQNAYDISKKDKVITNEERAIINSLVKSLMN